MDMTREFQRWYEYEKESHATVLGSLDILTQLFGHSLYHRGQIAMLVRNLGGQPVTTDFVFWCREPVPERE